MAPGAPHHPGARAAAIGPPTGSSGAAGASSSQHQLPLALPLLGADACVQGSWGAAFDARLLRHETDVLVAYGHDPTGGDRERAARWRQGGWGAPGCSFKLSMHGPPTLPSHRPVSVLGDKARNPASALQQLRDCDPHVRVLVKRVARRAALSLHDVILPPPLQEVYFAGLTLEGAVLASALDLRAAMPAVDACVFGAGLGVGSLLRATRVSSPPSSLPLSPASLPGSWSRTPAPRPPPPPPPPPSASRGTASL